jgi:hypothetical protein
MIGTEIDCTAQVVELLLEQQSIPPRELVARVAFANCVLLWLRYAPLAVTGLEQQLQA